MRHLPPNQSRSVSAARRLTVLLVTMLLASAVSTGCRRQEVADLPPVTESKVRATRRAYDGSPPVIPHQHFAAACTTCHTDTGKPIPDLAFAPANPHGDSGRLQNCKQCHMSRQADDVFAESDYQGLAVQPRKGDRLFAGAPPVIPHPLLMRENCLACHSGPAARPEIRCSHPERVNCKQCHVPKVTDALPSFATAR